MRSDLSSPRAQAPEGPTVDGAAARNVRPGFLLAVGGLLAVAVVVAGAVDWQRESEDDRSAASAASVLVASLERDKERLVGELQSARAANEASLGALQAEHEAKLAAALAAAAAAAQGGAAAEEIEAARVAVLRAQEERDAALARERAEGEQRLRSLRDGYETELAKLRAALDAAAAGEWFVDAPAPAAPAAPVERAGTAGDLAAGSIAAPPALDEDLRAWACSEEVALALGPFLEPGYAQLDNTFGLEKLPFSYAQLVATGALADDEGGWRTMHRIATSRRDVARTRWALEPGVAGTERIRRAQSLLRELGPTLVACGLLRP